MQKEQTEQRESTSIKIRPSIHKKAKIEAINHDKQLSDIIEEGIELWIKQQKEKEKLR
jgi:hypothetical protein